VESLSAPATDGIQKRLHGFSLEEISLFLGISARLFLPAEAAVFSIALVACLVPAWRAIRVNPMMALRYE